MGIMYSASFQAVAVTAAQDLFELVAAASTIAIVHSVHIGQSSEEGDAAAEMLTVQFTRGYTVSGSAGSTITPRALDPIAPAAVTTVEANNTTQANTGTPLTLFSGAFNVQAGFFYQPTPEERIVVSAASTSRLVLELVDTPADSITMSGTIVFEEIGG